MARGFGVAAALDHATIQQVAREAETAGYGSFWVNDTPGGDGLAALAAAAEVTRAIKLGVGVIPVDRRPADEIARDVVELGIPQDRLWLGIGSPDPKRALSKIRESVASLHEDLNCLVMIAALGPKMTSLAGEVADGVVFNWLTPEYVAKSAERVRAAASDAGRDAPLLTAYVRAGLLPGAAQRIETEAGRYAGVRAYANHFERQGRSAADTVVQGEDAQTLQAGIAPYVPLLDEVIVRALTRDDEPETISELLHACAPPAGERSH